MKILDWFTKHCKFDSLLFLQNKHITHCYMQYVKILTVYDCRNWIYLYADNATIRSVLINCALDFFISDVVRPRAKWCHVDHYELSGSPFWDSRTFWISRNGLCVWERERDLIVNLSVSLRRTWAPLPTWLVARSLFISSSRPGDSFVSYRSRPREVILYKTVSLHYVPPWKHEWKISYEGEVSSFSNNSKL